jgi:hypothetical protein
MQSANGSAVSSDLDDSLILLPKLRQLVVVSRLNYLAVRRAEERNRYLAFWMNKNKFGVT